MKKIFTTAFLILTILSCKKEIKVNNDQQTKTKTETKTVKNGGVEMITINANSKTFKVWTKRIGNNPKIKVLLLNGGPGMSHEYFECMESFFPVEGIEFIYYYQLGT